MAFLQNKAAIILILLTGILFGIGGFTMFYAEGLSYFSTDPAACANCHIMQPQYDSWQKASHHTVATCVDCHLPYDFINKYIAKAENGYNHSRAFTMQDFHEPILINEKNSRILQENCLNCHNNIVDQLVHGSVGKADAVKCIHCHITAGHGQRAGLGGPLTSSEIGDSSNE